MPVDPPAEKVVPAGQFCVNQLRSLGRRLCRLGLLNSGQRVVAALCVDPGVLQSASFANYVVAF